MGAVSAQSISQAGVIGTITGYMDSTKLLGASLIDIGKLLGEGVIGFALIVALQRLGFDPIGLVFNFLFFVFDFFFSILRFAIASEGNLVAFIVIFLVMWIFIMTL